MALKKVSDITALGASPASGDQIMIVDVDDSDNLKLITVGELATFPSSVKLATGGENSPDCTGGGLCLQQGDDDGNILTFKSTDVNHGMSSQEEVDTYLSAKKNDSNNGGVTVKSLTASNVGYNFLGMVSIEDTTDVTGSVSPFNVVSYTKSGTSVGSMGSTANLFTVRNSGTTRFLIKGNGDLHATNTTITALDDYNDIELARDLQLSLSSDEKHRLRVSKEGFSMLVQVGALSSTGDFQIMQGVNAVALGAISQLFNVCKGLAQKLGLEEAEVFELAKQY